MGKSIRNLKVVSSDEVAAKKIRDNYIDNTDGCDALRTRAGGLTPLNVMVHECMANRPLRDVNAQVFDRSERFKLVAGKTVEYSVISDDDLLPFITGLYTAVGEEAVTVEDFVKSDAVYPPKVKDILRMMSECMPDSFEELLKSLLDVKKDDNFQTSVKETILSFNAEKSKVHVQIQMLSMWKKYSVGQPQVNYFWNIELMHNINDLNTNNLKIRVFSEQVQLYNDAWKSDSEIAKSFKEHSKLAMHDQFGYTIDDERDRTIARGSPYWTWMFSPNMRNFAFPRSDLEE